MDTAQTINHRLPSGTKNVHLLRAVHLMEMEFYIKHLVHFRTTQICKSKEEYIRKFDKGAVFGYFAQGIFQLEHYED